MIKLLMFFLCLTSSSESLFSFCFTTLMSSLNSFTCRISRDVEDFPPIPLSRLVQNQAAGDTLKPAKERTFSLPSKLVYRPEGALERLLQHIFRVKALSQSDIHAGTDEVHQAFLNA